MTKSKQLQSSNKSETKTQNVNTEESESSQNTNKTYCICGLPYNPNHFYIGCDKCDAWYHGKCVKINEEYANFIDKYFCFRCQNKKSPSQGQAVLKRHLVNNNEIYVSPLNSEDPNMYYGFNPNKSPVTSRQKKLQMSKWKERNEKKEELKNLILQNENDQKELSNKINMALKRKETELNRIAVPVKKTRVLRSRIAKKKNSKMPLNEDETPPKTDSSQSTQETQEINPSIIDLETNLKKLLRFHAELKVQLFDLESVTSQSSMKNINKDVDSSLLRLADADTNSQPSAEYNPKLSNLEKVKNAKNTKTASKKNKEQKKTDKSEKKKIGKYAEGLTTAPPLSTWKSFSHIKGMNQSIKQPLVNTKGPLKQKSSDLQKVDIFSLSQPTGQKAETSIKTQSKNYSGDSNSLKMRVEKTRESALEHLQEVPGIKKELAHKLEGAAYAATSSRCSFWFDDTKWHIFAPEIEDNVHYEKDEGFQEEKSFKVNAYTQFVNRCLLRLNKYRHLRQNLLENKTNPAVIMVMTSKHLNEIERTGRYRSKSRERFETFLGKKDGAELEKIVYEQIGKKSMNEYGKKSRELIFNLRQNTKLREKIASGETSLKELCEMSEDQLASEKLTKWRQEINEKNLKQAIRSKPSTKSFKSNLAKSNTIEPKITSNYENETMIENIPLDETISEEKQIRIGQKTNDISAKNSKAKNVPYGFFLSDLYRNANNYIYSESGPWSMTIASYTKPKIINLKAIDVSFFQIGGPKIKTFPFEKQETMKMVGRLDLTKFSEFVKEMLNAPRLTKVPVAFEVRPFDENILGNYTDFCSYFIGIKRCPVFHTENKDFSLYMIPPNSTNIPVENVKRLLHCHPPEGCLWAIGYFSSEMIYRKNSEFKKSNETRKRHQSFESFEYKRSHKTSSPVEPMGLKHHSDKQNQKYSYQQRAVPKIPNQSQRTFHNGSQRPLEQYSRHQPKGHFKEEKQFMKDNLYDPNYREKNQRSQPKQIHSPRSPHKANLRRNARHYGTPRRQMAPRMNERQWKEIPIQNGGGYSDQRGYNNTKKEWEDQKSRGNYRKLQRQNVNEMNQKGERGKNNENNDFDSLIFNAEIDE